VLVTFPRDTRPCMLTENITVPPGNPQLTLEIGYLRYRPWRLQVFVDDDIVTTQAIGVEDSVDIKQVQANAAAAAPLWQTLTLDLSRFEGRKVSLRLYQWLLPEQIPGAAYWRSVRIE
jgi:hypothetical protein